MSESLPENPNRRASALIRDTMCADRQCQRRNYEWSVHRAIEEAAAVVLDRTVEQHGCREYTGRAVQRSYLGQVHGTMAALKHMRSCNRGTIVQVGSALSYRAIPLQSAYCGAKFAIRGFTDALRSELEHDRSRIRLTMVQLPAVNTPQFDWAQSRLPYRAQPVPPIFEPEAIAREIIRASVDAPRELWIGRSAVKAIIGTMLLPGLGDHILAREGYSGQMTSEPEPTGRPDNLFEPVLGGDHGAWGRFSNRAEPTVFGISPTWLRAGLACLVAGVVVGELARAQRVLPANRHTTSDLRP
jgi:short chain dehydrogenase